jgi:ketosteroid isomerase-like protein
MLESMSDDAEWRIAREHPASRMLRGPAEIRSYLEDWLESMQRLRMEADEIRESGDYVLVIARVMGTGTGSGVELEIPLATLSTIRDGVSVRTEEFLDLEEARREFASRSASQA